MLCYVMLCYIVMYISLEPLITIFFGKHLDVTVCLLWINLVSGLSLYAINCFLSLHAVISCLSSYVVGSCVYVCVPSSTTIS